MTLAGHNSDFMRHVYTALLTGDVLGFTDTAKKESIRMAADDLCTVARTLPKEEQALFLQQIQIRMTGGN